MIQGLVVDTQRGNLLKINRFGYVKAACHGTRPLSYDEQRRLYAHAVAQIAHNTALLRPGASFREVSEKAWRIPDEFMANRYGSLIHGVGLADEYPSLKHRVDFDEKGYDGIIEEGMTLCVESYIGATGGREGVKIEEQVLVTENGIEQLSSYPLELDWM